MITGQIKNQMDQIWDTFWTGGISNSIDILKQMTYLFFMKLIEEVDENNEPALFFDPNSNELYLYTVNIYYKQKNDYEGFTTR